MNILLVYDSKFGNTEKIAHAVASGFSSKDKVQVVQVCDAASDDVRGKDLLVVGSPTHGGRPTECVQDFFDLIPEGALSHLRVAAFDTGIRAGDLNLFLKLLVKTIGYASPRMAKQLEAKGGRLAAPPTTFFVKGKEGPLLEGELERAKKWAGDLT